MKTINDVLIEFKEKPKLAETLPVLTLTERKGFILQSEKFNKRVAKEDTSSYKVISELDIAFNPYLLWAGAVAQNTIVCRGVISPLYPTFRVREGYDPGYISRLLLAPDLISAYDSIAYGSVPRRRRSSVADFLTLPLPSLPPLAEQRRIAAILDHADAIRTKRRKVLEHFDSLRAAIFQDLFGPTNPIPTTRLDAVASVSSGITKGRRTSDPTRSVPYLAVANVQAGHLALEVIKEIQATDAEIARYALRPGDLVITEGGDPDKLGRGTVWRGEVSLCLHQNHIFRVRITDRTQLLDEYLSAFFGDRRAKDYFLRSAKQTTGIASINMTQLKALPVPVPSPKEQQTFADRIQHLNTQRLAVERALAADNELFASLQSRAFRGEL